jgi:hypothetical protein
MYNELNNTRAACDQISREKVKRHAALLRSYVFSVHSKKRMFFSCNMCAGKSTKASENSTQHSACHPEKERKKMPHKQTIRRNLFETLKKSRESRVSLSLSILSQQG